MVLRVIDTAARLRHEGVHAHDRASENVSKHV